MKIKNHCETYIICDNCKKSLYPHEIHHLKDVKFSFDDNQKDYCEKCYNDKLEEFKQLQGEKENNVFDFFNDTLELVECENCDNKIPFSEITCCNGENVCLNCKENEFLECEHCKELFKKDDMINNDDYYFCEECHDELYSYCDNCEEYHEIDNMYYSEIKEKMYCEDCKNEVLNFCYDCNEEIDEDTACYHDSTGYWCSDCFSENFRYCENCETDYPVDECHYSDNDDCYYCENCYSENSDVHNYSYAPCYKFHRCEYEKNALLLGIELEVEHDEEKANAYLFNEFLDTNNYNDYFYLKDDASIDGFEIVTQPMTAQFINKNINFKSILKYLQSNNYRSFTGGNCGLHIHVNKNFFSNSEIAKLRLFITDNFERLHKFSQRHGNLNFCENENFNLHDFIDNVITNNQKNQNTRYTALNCETSTNATIEFRLFRGTLDFKRFKATLQFVNAVCHYVKLIGYNTSWFHLMVSIQRMEQKTG